MGTAFILQACVILKQPVKLNILLYLCDFLFNYNALNFCFSSMDEDQGLDEGLKHTQSKESPRREETRNGKHQPLQHMYNKLN